MSYLISLILLLLPTYLVRFSIPASPAGGFGIPTTLLEILIYLIFLYGLYQARKIGFRKIPAKIYLPIGLLVIALIISAIISPDKRTALGEFKGFFIDPLLVFWLIYQFIKKENLPKLFWALILSGFFVACHTIIQKLLGHTTADGRVIGIFGYSPNYLALFLAPITVLLTAYGLQLTAQRKYWLSAVSCLLLAVSLIAIYFSGSRGGFLAIAAGIGVYFGASISCGLCHRDGAPKKPYPRNTPSSWRGEVYILARYWFWIRAHLASKIIVAILILIALYTAWTFFRPDFSVTRESGGRIASSNNVRWQIWQTSLELGAKHPILGVGLGNFQNSFDELTRNRGNFPEYITPMALTPHNLFLMFWASCGLLGLVAFIWLLVTFYRECFCKLKDEYSPILLAVMSSIVIYGLIEASIWKNDLSIIFWAIWGMIWTIENSKFKSPLPSARHSNAK